MSLQEQLNIRDLKLFTPEGRLLIEDLSFDLSAGQVVLVQGGNGSGKTTLIRCILGLWKHYQGAVHLSPTSDEISYLPQVQSPEIHMPINVQDVLSIAAPNASEEDVLSMGLLERRHLPLAWNSTSGGEKKRTLLTRSLLKAPQLLLLDEPFNHLDKESHELIGSCLLDFVQKQKGALILVSHESKTVDLFAALPTKRITI